MSNPEDQNGNDENRRVSFSIKQLREEIANGIKLAVLDLQLKLIATYAVKADVDRVQLLAKAVADNADRKSDEMERLLKEQSKAIEALERDKAGRDAVTNFKKWLTGGAILATVFMGIQLVLSFYLITHGTKKP
jgi:hypothetical protein